jgi:hypothetical protein
MSKSKTNNNKKQKGENTEMKFKNLKNSIIMFLKEYSMFKPPRYNWNSVQSFISISEGYSLCL